MKEERLILPDRSSCPPLPERCCEPKLRISCSPRNVHIHVVAGWAVSPTLSVVTLFVLSAFIVSLVIGVKPKVCTCGDNSICLFVK